MPEQWAPIPGASGYVVSSEGRVRSHRPWRGTTERILNPATNQVSGYQQIALPGGGGWKTVYIHSLVLLAFVGPVPDGHEVRHLDGNPANNTLSNLAYGTHAENVQDTLRHGTHPMASRTHCKHGHEYTPENTSIWRSRGKPYRQCVTCADKRRAEGFRRRALAERPRAA